MHIVHKIDYDVWWRSFFLSFFFFSTMFHTLFVCCFLFFWNYMYRSQSNMKRTRHESGEYVHFNKWNCKKCAKNFNSSAGLRQHQTKKDCFVLFCLFFYVMFCFVLLYFVLFCLGFFFLFVCLLFSLFVGQHPQNF